MTWHQDLSKYSYGPTVPAGQVALSVGWLEHGHDFPTGEVPQEFVDELAKLCAQYGYARTRGWHECDLPHGNDELEYPCRIPVNGERVPLGSAEVRVATDSGTVLAAPNLIWHYVTYHRYLPPEEFIRAVLEHRPAPPEYNPWSTN